MSAADGDMPMRCCAEDDPPAGGEKGLCVPGSGKVHVSRELGVTGNVKKEEGMSAPGGKTGAASAAGGETPCRARAWAKGCRFIL